jgi:hypothetical protein
MNTDQTAPSRRAHIPSAVAICLASALAGGIAFDIWSTHITKQLGDVCPWFAQEHGHPVRVGALAALGAGLLALLGMLLRRTHLRWPIVLVAAVLTAAAAAALALLSWQLIGDCVG